MNKIRLLIFTLLLSSCSFDTDVDDTADTISPDALVIGVMGRYRNNTDPFARGVQMAVDEVNKSGGVGGKKLDLVFRKSDCSPDVARYEAENLLIQYSQIIAITGPECSGAGNAINEVMGPHNIPIVAYTTSSPSLSKVDTFFRLQASDLAIIEGFVSSIMQENDLNEDGTLNVGIIYGDDLFNAGLGGGVHNGIIENGGDVGATVIYPDGVLVDFDQYVERLFSPNGDNVDYDVLVVMGFENEIANIMQQFAQYANATDLDISSIPIYTSGLDLVVLTDAPAEILVNAITLTPDGAFSPLVFPNLIEFLSRFNEYWDSSETAEDAAQGYDAMMLLALSLMQAQELGQINVNNAAMSNIRQAIVDNIIDVSRGDSDFEEEGDQLDTVYINPNMFVTAIEAVKNNKDINYNGASGYIDFDQNGDINYGAFFRQKAVLSDNEFILETLKLSCFGPITCSE